jgi:hypothetical protein
MKRLSRHLFTILSAASMLLCIVTAVLWARSYNVLYQLRRITVDTRTANHRTVTVVLASGRLQLVMVQLPGDPAFLAEGIPPTGWKLHRDS